MNEQDMLDILETTKVIASVGLSSKPERPSYKVGRYLQERGYRVIPVNPFETEVLGEKAYPELSSVPEKIDVVQVFRKPEDVPPVVKDAIAVGAKVVWMQDGAGNEEAAAEARAAGLKAVVDDCMLRQHARLIGASDPS